MIRYVSQNCFAPERINACANKNSSQVLAYEGFLKLPG